jgi:hypothetical protein
MNNLRLVLDKMFQIISHLPGVHVFDVFALSPPGQRWGNQPALTVYKSWRSLFRCWERECLGLRSWQALSKLFRNLWKTRERTSLVCWRKSKVTSRYLLKWCDPTLTPVNRLSTGPIGAGDTDTYSTLLDLGRVQCGHLIIFPGWKSPFSEILSRGAAWNNGEGIRLVVHRGFLPATDYLACDLWSSHFTLIASSFEGELKPSWPECLCHGKQ